MNLPSGSRLRRRIMLSGALALFAFAPCGAQESAAGGDPEAGGGIQGLSGVSGNGGRAHGQYRAGVVRGFL